MKHKLIAVAISAAVTLGFGVAAASSASAAMGAAQAAVSAAVPAGHAAGVEEVQYREYRDYRGGGRSYRRDGPRHYDRHEYDPRRYYRRDYPRRHYRNYRPSPGVYFEFNAPVRRYVEPRYVQPRYVEPRPVYRASTAHYRWCESRYRSYRAYDNTYQPYYGPRRQCISPYV